jgi:hypothetical protein
MLLFQTNIFIKAGDFRRDTGVLANESGISCIAEEAADERERNWVPRWDTG